MSSDPSAPPLRPLDHCDRTLKEDSHAYAQQPTAPPPRERPAPRASLPRTPDRGLMEMMKGQWGKKLKRNVSTWGHQNLGSGNSDMKR